VYGGLKWKERLESLAYEQTSDRFLVLVTRVEGVPTLDFTLRPGRLFCPAKHTAPPCGLEDASSSLLSSPSLDVRVGSRVPTLDPTTQQSATPWPSPPKLHGGSFSFFSSCPTPETSSLRPRTTRPQRTKPQIPTVGREPGEPQLLRVAMLGYFRQDGRTERLARRQSETPADEAH